MDIDKYASIAFLAVFGAALLLIVYGTVVKNKWGINLRRVSCPTCGTQMGQLRMPKSGKQAIWGGWTCPNCQSEVDKWGRPTTTENA
jgi:hypothetical protein